MRSKGGLERQSPAGEPFRPHQPDRLRPEIGAVVTEYLAIIEREGDTWGAYVPDLPGCVAVGETRERAEDLIAEAIALHIESLREHGEPVPPPTTTGSMKVQVK